MKRLSWIPGLFATVVLLAAAGVAYGPPPVGGFRPAPAFRPAPRPQMPHFEPPAARPIIRPGGGLRPGIHPDIVPGHAEPVRPNPIIVRTQVQGLITNRPADAIAHLGGQPGSVRVLSQAEVTALGRTAAERLAVQVETGGQSGANLALARNARASAGTLDPSVKRSLDGVVRMAEQQVHTDAISEVGRLLEGALVRDAARQAAQWLQRLGPAEASVKGEVPEALGEVARVGRQADALEAARTGLRQEGGLQKVNVGEVGEGLRGVVEGLRGLEALRQQAGAQAIRPEVVKAAVAQFEAGLARVPGADVTLGKQVLLDFAVREFLEGRQEAFRSLWPADAPASHAAEVLRDLKALTLGEGKVGTWAGERAVSAEPGRGGDNPRGPPPGLEPLIPEGARAGWKPPVRESAKADLPPLEKAAEVGKALHGQAEAGLKSEQDALAKRTTAAQDKVKTAALHLGERAEADRRRLAAVEAAAARRLEPAERARVRHLTAMGQTDAQIVQQFKPAAADDDEKFLQEVAKRLGRALTPAERAEALRLRKTGCTAAEAVNGVRHFLEEQAKADPLKGLNQLRLRQVQADLEDPD
jgi:hypothetical protein